MLEPGVNKARNLVFFSSDANRSDTREGRAWDKVLDPIALRAEEKGFSTAIFAYPGSVLHGGEAFLRVDPIEPKLVSPANRILRRALAKAPRGSQVLLLRLLSDFNARLMTILGKIFGTNPYRRLLVKTKPQLVFAANAPPLLCEAAKSLRIPVAEVLHARGYSRVYKSWDSRQHTQLPDGIISYHAASTEVFSKFLPVLQVPNYRFPFEEKLAKKWELSPEGRHYLERLTQFPHVVAFTTTWSEDPVSSEFLDGGIPAELLNLVMSREDIFLQIRLHPVLRFRRSFRKRTKKLIQELNCCSRIDFQTSSSAPIHSIFRASTIHMTYQSLAAFEAADVGLSTYFLRIKGGRKWPPELLEQGLMRPLGASRSELEFAIEKAVPRNPINPQGAVFDIGQTLSWASRL